MFLFAALGSLMCSFLPGAPAALWQRDVVHVQTGTHRYRHCHFAAAGLCVACKSLFFLKRKKFQISFRKVRTMHAKGIKNLMEKSSWKTVCVERVTITPEGWGLAWLYLDLVVLESDGALHQKSKIKALKGLEFALSHR